MWVCTSEHVSVWVRMCALWLTVFFGSTSKLQSQTKLCIGSWFSVVFVVIMWIFHKITKAPKRSSIASENAENATKQKYISQKIFSFSQFAHYSLPNFIKQFSNRESKHIELQLINISSNFKDLLIRELYILAWAYNFQNIVRPQYNAQYEI